MSKLLAELGKLIEAVEDGLTPARRKRIYRTVQAVLLVLALHGAVDAETVAGYLQALVLFLGIAPAEVAARNTPA